MVETLVLMALSVGASYLAASLQDKPKQKNFARDDKPTTLAERGAFVPYVRGTRQIGLIFAFAGNRVVRKEVTGSTGGKGSSKKKTYANIYHEDGWHALCVGPGNELQQIRQDGIVIFPRSGQSALNIGTTPSGSRIDLGREGSFTIYWGECDQPINADYAEHVGISSRWPHVMSVYWHGKRLGSSARWPAMDYIVKVLGAAEYDPFGETYVMHRVGGNMAISKYSSEDLDVEIWQSNSFVATDNIQEILVISADGTHDAVLFTRDVTDTNNILRFDRQTGAILWTSAWQLTGDSVEQPAFTRGQVYAYVIARSNVITKVRMSDGNIEWSLAASGYIASANHGACVAHPINDNMLGSMNNTSLGGKAIYEFNKDSGAGIGRWNSDTGWSGNDHGREWSWFLYDEDSNTIIALGSREPLDAGDAWYSLLPGNNANATAYNATTGAVVWRANIGDNQLNIQRGLIFKGFLYVGGGATGNGSNLLKASLASGFEGQVVDSARRFQNTCVFLGTDGHRIYYGQAGLGDQPTIVVDADDLSVEIARKDPSIVHDYAAEAVTPRAISNVSAATERNGGVAPEGLFRELLTASYPHGLGLHPSLVSLTSLQEMQQVTESENVGFNIVVADGLDGAQVVADMMQDLGCFLRENGFALEFKMIRSEATAPLLTDDFILPPEPTLEYQTGPTKVDRMVYIFSNAEFNYRDDPVQMDDDSSASLYRRNNSQKVQISSVTDYVLAAAAASRREQEAIAGLIGYTFHVTRDARDMRPGDTFIVEDRGAFLCMSNRFSDNGRSSEIDAIVNYVGEPAPTFIPGAPYDSHETADVAPDDPFFAIEMPYSFDNTSTVPRLGVLRNRAHVEILAADQWLSADGVSFDLAGNQSSFHPGGDLEEAIPAGVHGIIETGPTFTTDDPAGISSVEDLSGNEAGWRSGLQVAVIADVAGSGDYEILFVRELQALGSNQYRMLGLIRGRGETQPIAHPIGARVFMLNPTELTPIEHQYLALEQSVYVKSQPRTLLEIQDLSEVTAQVLTIQGNYARPLPVDNFFGNFQQRSPNATTGRHNNEYGTGDDVVFTWNYRIKPGQGLGAGELNAGVAIGNESPAPEGTFEIDIYTIADAFVKTISGLSTPTYTYTNADIINDLGSEVSFKARVRHVNGAFSTDEIQITITKV